MSLVMGSLVGCQQQADRAGRLLLLWAELFRSLSKGLKHFLFLLNPKEKFLLTPTEVFKWELLGVWNYLLSGLMIILGVGSEDDRKPQ